MYHVYMFSSPCVRNVNGRKRKYPFLLAWVPVWTPVGLVGRHKLPLCTIPIKHADYWKQNWFIAKESIFSASVCNNTERHKPSNSKKAWQGHSPELFDILLEVSFSPECHLPFCPLWPHIQNHIFSHHHSATAQLLHFSSWAIFKASQGPWN